MFRFRLLSVLALVLLIVSACGGAPSVANTQPPATTAPVTATSGIPTLQPTALPEATAAAEPTTLQTTEPTDTATNIPLPTPDDVVTAAVTADPEDTPESIMGPLELEPPTTTATTAALDAKWSVDSDGNVVPDFLEVELGADPMSDECANKACGGAPEGADLLLKERNTLLILDSSGSMAVDAGGGQNKLDAAKAALNRYVQVVANAYNLGFIVYGHKGNNTDAGKAESCVGIDILAPIGQLQRENFQGILDQFQPTGWTPIAASLTKAGEAFAGKEDAVNRIILVSDGIETCEGDPVAVAQQLHAGGFAVQIDVLGYDIDAGSADAEQLQKIAEVTGGTYYDAKTAADLDTYFKQQGEAIGETYDNMVCEVSNFAQANICDTSFINKVQARLRDLEFAATSDAEADAYQELADRINTAYDERQQSRQDAQARFEELKDQYFDLREQVQRALTETYVGQ